MANDLVRLARPVIAIDPAGGALQTLAAEISAYPAAFVKISIVSPTYVEGGTPGSTVNQGETWKFSIQVENSGLLGMDKVVVQYVGGGVATGRVLFGDDALVDHVGHVDFGQVSPGSAVTKGPFLAHIPADVTSAGNVVNLVVATIDGWDPNLDAFLRQVSGASASPRGIWKAEVQG